MMIPDHTKATIVAALVGRQKCMFNLLAKGLPVTIELLYGTSIVREATKTKWVGLSRRAQQQRLGSPIAEMNKLLKPYKLGVKPGDPRGTYSLVAL